MPGPAEMALMIPLVAVTGVIFLGALAILRGDRRRGNRAANVEEAQMIQDIYHGLLKMEARIEALETLLLDRDREAEARNPKEAQS